MRQISQERDGKARGARHELGTRKHPQAGVRAATWQAKCGEERYLRKREKGATKERK